MPLVMRRAIIRPPSNPAPRVRGSVYFRAPVSVPTPVGIALIPSNIPLLFDSAVIGALVATVSVATSDGSPFTGVIAFAAPFQNTNGLLSISGGASVMLTRNLTTADIGSYNFTVAATQNSGVTVASFPLIVSGLAVQVDQAGDIQAVDTGGDTLIIR